MKRTLFLALIVGMLATSGCAFIAQPQGGGAMGGFENATGEAWYVKNNFFLFFLTSSEVYHCDGSGTCTEATVQ